MLYLKFCTQFNSTHHVTRVSLILFSSIAINSFFCVQNVNLILFIIIDYDFLCITYITFVHNLYNVISSLHFLFMCKSVFLYFLYILFICILSQIDLFRPFTIPTSVQYKFVTKLLVL